MRILAVTNIYPSAQNPESGVFVQQQILSLQQAGLQIDVMNLNRTKKGMRVYLRLGERVRERMRASATDLVHVMYGGVMADMVTEAVQDVPTMVTFHGSDLLGDRSAGSLRRLFSGYGVWSSWRAARRANGIILVAKSLQSAMPAFIDNSKIRVIPCGIDLNRFKPMSRSACQRELGWRPDCFHVLFPSNSDRSVKRYALASAAVDRLTRSGVCAEIHKLEAMPNENVPFWLNAGNVLLLTSLHEGSPTVVKEALACNLPVVSVDVGDVRERIKGIEGCYLASPNPEDLASKLRLVNAGPGRVASRINAQEISLEHVASRLKEFYESVCRSGQRSGERGIPVAEMAQFHGKLSG
jgi:hypothetical protein